MDIPLGKPTDYPQRYDPGLLAPMPRQPAREAMGLDGPLPFVGEDVWNGYEFSWLNPRGLPQVAGIRLRIDAASPCIVESKSMKLYLNGFGQTRYSSRAAVVETLRQDLAGAFGAEVDVAMRDLGDLEPASERLPGVPLDRLDIAVEDYQRNLTLLSSDAAAAPVTETLHTHLFRSLCPVTGQPDWASLMVAYTGPPVDHAGLLRYLVSYRNHQAFHEATVEQIFVDLKLRCRCERLMVTGSFLRRGGIDINPVRASEPGWSPPPRLARQ